MSKNTGKIIFAGLLGAAAGAIGGLLLAPKSGKETRDDISKIALDIKKAIKTTKNETEDRVKEIYGKVSTEAVEKYNEITSLIVDKVAAAKKAGNEIDKDKYSMIVDDIVAEFKDDLSTTKNGALKIASMMKKDWNKVKKAILTKPLDGQE